MNDIIENLLKLQTLQFNKTTDAGMEKQAAELRAKIPMQILGHYDRLVARGKKGVAIIRNQVCTACHMNVPRGAVLTLMRGDDIQLCECCGRYLYLPAQTAAAEPPAPKKAGKRQRKQDVLLRAA